MSKNKFLVRFLTKNQLVASRSFIYNFCDNSPNRHKVSTTFPFSLPFEQRRSPKCRLFHITAAPRNCKRAKQDAHVDRRKCCIVVLRLIYSLLSAINRYYSSGLSLRSRRRPNLSDLFAFCVCFQLSERLEFGSRTAMRGLADTRQTLPFLVPRQLLRDYSHLRTLFVRP